MSRFMRFYKVAQPDRLAQRCRAVWNLPANANIGPVDTNFTNDIEHLHLVVVCESPSKDEVRFGFPTVGRTGTRIFNLWHLGNNRSRKKKYGFKFFKQRYRLFAENGIYITNLVRCRADYGLSPMTKYINQKTKNDRVHDAFRINLPYLVEEIKCIVENSEKTVCVLFACGIEFEQEIKQAVSELRRQQVDFRWLSTFHPSRCRNKFAWHYNPQEWVKRKVVGTTVSDRKEKNQ